MSTECNIFFFPFMVVSCIKIWVGCNSAKKYVTNSHCSLWGHLMFFTFSKCMARKYLSACTVFVIILTLFIMWALFSSWSIKLLVGWWDMGPELSIPCLLSSSLLLGLFLDSWGRGGLMEDPVGWGQDIIMEIITHKEISAGDWEINTFVSWRAVGGMQKV